MTHEYEYEGRCCGPNCNNANGCVWDNTHCVDKWGQCGIKEEEVSSLTSDEHHVPSKILRESFNESLLQTGCSKMWRHGRMRRCSLSR